MATARPGPAVAAPALRAASKRPINRLPPQQRIADIMSAAKDVFARRGYDHALITEIAQQAGVVEGSIYRFFSNKRELLIKVVELWFETMIRDSAEQLCAVQGTRHQIRFIVHRHLASIQREPALSRLVFQEIRPSPEYRGSRLFELNRAYTNRLVDVVKAGCSAGELRPDVSPTLVRDMVFGCIEHRTWAFLRNEGAFDPAAVADAITDLVLGGIAAPAVATPGEAVTARLEQVASRLEAAAAVTALPAAPSSGRAAPRRRPG